ncbi:hypothetical protein A2Z22_02645 [Candidatus Woesebacteria bacterium RBG_16_34_12]|uniref:Uncharacterized protein n=1 Tax=Candidatus Woesebacteria bacterium RBG_16_34_12 TaxID=1802480 RepID=A0A1F7X8P5_9BACT|nr:MAG: hypothetical protein A2Z22_02645 [Candidatus Woesebacteria bacterium RBG_16_34_12]
MTIKEIPEFAGSGDPHPENLAGTQAGSGNPEEPDVSEVQDRVSKEEDNIKRVRRWLKGQTLPTEEELAQMPKFSGPNADLEKRQWLKLHREQQLDNFLSGEGRTPFDGEERFGGRYAEAYRSFISKHHRSVSRMSALRKWLEEDQ